MRFSFSLLFVVTLLSDLTVTYAQTTPEPASERLIYADEKHFANLRQLTFGGDNAEAYFSFDGKSITFQRTHKERGPFCDQIFVGQLPVNPEDSFQYHQVSSGEGRTTCAYFMPSDQQIIYASTHLGGKDCPPVPDRSKIKKYVWPIYPSYDLFVANVDGTMVKQLTHEPGYDAEPTLSPKKDKIIFTSMRNGDLDLYVMDTNGENITQITHELGYDGGAWISPDGKKIVWRASRPSTPESIEEYKTLLSQGLVAPTQMEVYVANIDGTDVRQITSLGKANWAPNFTPDGKRIIFASNHEYERGFPFNMYLINLDGTGLEKISHDGGFDAFPMFSPDGKKLIFSSNRHNGGTHDTNVFICDWID